VVGVVESASKKAMEGEAAVQGRSEISEVYSKMSEDELLRLASQKDSLLPLGQEVLKTEMQKRGMDETAVVSFRLGEEELAQQEKQRTTSEKKARAKNRHENFKRMGIFLTAAIVTDWLASQLFNLPSKAIEALTQMSLYLAFAASGLALGFGGTWLTVRKTIAVAAGLSVCFLAWVIYMTATAAK
jgi:hypothetical protein